MVWIWRVDGRSARQLLGYMEAAQAGSGSAGSEVQAAAMRADLARLKLQQAQAAISAAHAQVGSCALHKMRR